MAQQDRTCTNNCSVVCGECQVFKPMAQQTAVEWFQEKTWKLNMQLERKEISIGQFAVQYKETFEQAIQMGKEQIKDAWGDGMKSDNGHFGTADDYYTQTYTTRLQNETN